MNWSEQLEAARWMMAGWRSAPLIRERLLMCPDGGGEIVEINGGKVSCGDLPT
jgi:hypothetical protein